MILSPENIATARASGVFSEAQMATITDPGVFALTHDDLNALMDAAREEGVDSIDIVAEIGEAMDRMD